jgi:hypothetical protein
LQETDLFFTTSLLQNSMIFINVSVNRTHTKNRFA